MVVAVSGNPPTLMRSLVCHSISRYIYNRRTKTVGTPEAQTIRGHLAPSHGRSHSACSGRTHSDTGAEAEADEFWPRLRGGHSPPAPQALLSPWARGVHGESPLPGQTSSPHLISGASTSGQTLNFTSARVRLHAGHGPYSPSAQDCVRR